MTQQRRQLEHQYEEGEEKLRQTEYSMGDLREGLEEAEEAHVLLQCEIEGGITHHAQSMTCTPCSLCLLPLLQSFLCAHALTLVSTIIFSYYRTPIGKTRIRKSIEKRIDGNAGRIGSDGQ